MRAVSKREDGTNSIVAAPTRRPPNIAAADPRNEAALEELTVDTVHGSIAVRQTAGKDLPVLFLHGNSSRKEVFEAQFRSRLGQRYRLIAFDLPGHGASSDADQPGKSYTIPGYAEAAIAVLDALDISQVALVGWSLGGHVALEVAATFPGVVGVMITGTPPLAHGIEALQQAFMPHALTALAGQADFSETQISQFAQAISGSRDDHDIEAAIRRTDGRAREFMFKSLLQGQFTNERDLVEHMTTPIAIVTGANDPIVNKDYLAGIAFANLWAGSCQFIPRSGHAPFLDAAEVFNALLSEFLGDINPSGGRA